MKSVNDLSTYSHSLMYFIHSLFHSHPHKPQDACAEVVWLTRVTQRTWDIEPLLHLLAFSSLATMD